MSAKLIRLVARLQAKQHKHFNNVIYGDGDREGGIAEGLGIAIDEIIKVM
jgi:hypothetical protein